jgi:hypothetical protein
MLSSITMLLTASNSSASRDDRKASTALHGKQCKHIGSRDDFEAIASPL